MLQVMRHRGPDGAGFSIGGVSGRSAKLQDLAMGGRRGRVALGHVRLAITGGADGIQPFESRDGRLVLLHNGEIYNYRELREQLSDGFQQGTGSDSEIVMRHLEQEYQGDLRAALLRLLPRLDGVYALAVTDGEETIIVRDRVGVRQLYYCQTQGQVVFASEKKPLWALVGAAARVERVLPGHLLAVRDGRAESVCFWRPDSLRNGTTIDSRETALEAYNAAIRGAVAKRVRGRDRVGLIFSGGIDSVLVGHLVQATGVPQTCYTVGCGPASTDVTWARRVAGELGFSLQYRCLTEKEIEALIPEVIRDIEDHSLNQVEVGIPIHVANRMAQEAGERVLLNGQGADELFGGYPWYGQVMEREGYDQFVRRSWEDTCLLYKECLEREDKISMAHSLELRVPFLDPSVVKVAFQIAPELKVRSGNDPLGKHIHREYCCSVGIPEPIANRVKEAAQHGANIHATLERLAKKRAPSATQLRTAGYDPDLSVTEKLGSSSRYGYRYGDESLWKPSAQVQFYLDTQAARLDLLPPLVRDHWDDVNRRLPQPAL
jgi:asparagine synthase (glutamine-hydrolysing)